MIDTTTRKYRDLFAPADHGEWSLPPAVTEARIVLARVTEALAQVVEPPPLQEVKDEAVQATLRGDNPLDADLTALLDHARLRDERDTRVAVLREAQQRADAQLAAAMYDYCDRIIVECLRPAGEAIWVETSKAARLLGDLDCEDTSGLLRASAKVRQAWLDLGELAARYGRVRAAMERLLLHVGDPPKHDVYADHGEFERGLCTIIGPGWRSAPMLERRRMPWPTEPRARVTWLVRHDCTPWFATVEQRDEAWLIVHREEHERMQRQQQRHRIAQSWQPVIDCQSHVLCKAPRVCASVWHSGATARSRQPGFVITFSVLPGTRSSGIPCLPAAPHPLGVALPPGSHRHREALMPAGRTGPDCYGL